MRGEEFSESKGINWMHDESKLGEGTAAIDVDADADGRRVSEASSHVITPWDMSPEDTRTSRKELALLSDDGISLEMMDDDSPQTTMRRAPEGHVSDDKSPHHNPSVSSPPPSTSALRPKSPEPETLPNLLPFPRHSRTNPTRHRPTISSISTATHTLVSISSSFPPPSPHDPLTDFGIIDLAQPTDLVAHRRSYSEPIPSSQLPPLRSDLDLLPPTLELPETPPREAHPSSQRFDQPFLLSDQLSPEPSPHSRRASPGQSDGDASPFPSLALSPPTSIYRSASGPFSYELTRGEASSSFDAEQGWRRGPSPPVAESDSFVRSVSAPIESLEEGSRATWHPEPSSSSLSSPKCHSAASPAGLPALPSPGGSSSKSSAVHPEPLDGSRPANSASEAAVDACNLDVSSRQSALGMLMEIDGRFISHSGGAASSSQDEARNENTRASLSSSDEVQVPVGREAESSGGGVEEEEEGGGEEGGEGGLSKPRPMPLKLSHWMAVAGGKASWSLGGVMIPGFDEEGDSSLGGEEQGGNSVDWLRGVVGEGASGGGMVGASSEGVETVGGAEDALLSPVALSAVDDMSSPLPPSSARSNGVVVGETGVERSGSNAGDVVRPPRSKVISINESGRQDSASKIGRWKFMDGSRASQEKDRSREVSVNAPQMRKRLTPLRSASRAQLGQLSFSVSMRSMQVAKAATSVLTRARGVLRFAIRKSKGEMSVKQLHLHKVLGQGAFGVVHLVTRRWHGKDMFALKSMDKRDLFKRNEMDHVMCEKYALQTLRHPFIVQMRKSFQDPMRVYFLLEFVSGGDLFSRLEERGRLSETTTRFYACEVLIALSYMHDLSFVYRDLKPENILIDGEGHVKLTDLGFARKLARNEKRYTFVGTPDYLAPEIVQNKGHDKAVDFWAFGVLLYELMAGYTPFYAPSVTEKYSKIVLGNIRWPTCFDAKACSLIQALLHPDPARRLGSGPRGAKEVMEHAWFEEIDWTAAAARKIQPPYVPPAYKHVKPKRYIDRLELYRWHGGNGGLVGLKGGSAISPDSAPSSPLSLEMQRHFEAF